MREVCPSCLQEVLALAPHEDYIRKHLAIIRSKLAETSQASQENQHNQQSQQNQQNQNRRQAGHHLGG